MSPSLDDIQTALNKVTSHVLEVSRGIAQWGQERFQVVSHDGTGGSHRHLIKKKILLKQGISEPGTGQKFEPV